MKNRPYPLYMTLPQLENVRQMLEIKASTCPDKVAFRYMPTRKVIVEKTYKEVYQEARYLATYLLKRGVRNRNIALMGENSYQWLISFLAIIISGNVAVLLAKEFSATEVGVLMAQTDTDLIVASKNCIKVLEPGKKKLGRVRIMDLSEVDEWIDKGRKFYERGRHPLDGINIDVDKPCAIFFTSGTSGSSKAVLHTQRSLMTNINQSAKNFLPPENSSTMAVLPFNHAFGLNTSVLMAFHYGVDIFINSSLADFMKEIPVAKPTVLFLVPLFVETFSKTI